MTPARLDLESHVRCGEEAVGDLWDVVLDPNERRITHLVVGVAHEQTRLVPFDRVEPERRDGAVVLSCSAEELMRMQAVRALAYVAMDEEVKGEEGWDVGIEDVVALPSYEPTVFGDFVPSPEASAGIAYDRIPHGEIELRHESPVHASDGERLGHLVALVLDGDALTHIVLHRGHLWGKHDVAIPVASLSALRTDTVTTSLSEAEVDALPPLST